MTSFTIKLFGHLAVSDDRGQPVAIAGAKQRALLAYLSLNLGRPASRDRLMGLLWGDRFDEQARQSLRQALTKLRKLAGGGEPLLRSFDDAVGLDPAIVSVDAIEFERLAEASDTAALVRATELYAGPLFEDLFLKEATFDEWAGAERARFNALACTVFERAARQRRDAGNSADAIEIAQRLVGLDPLREPSHRLLMKLLADSGQRAAALKQYANCASVLSVELGVEPDAETRALVEEIRTEGGAARVAPDASPPASSLGSVKPGVAVLPFVDLSENGAGESLARSITEDISAALTRYRWLSVIGRFSPGIDPQQLNKVARDQGAAYGVEGSIRRSAGRLRVNVQLIDLRSGRYISVRRYDREVSDLLLVQDEISDQIAGTIEPELAAAEGQWARNKEEGELDAWDCYHLGLAAQYRFSKEANLEAQALYRRALEKDPEFPAAYARLAYAMVIEAIYFEAKPVDAILDEAIELARRAARLDDQDALARFALGRALLARGDYDLSVRELETAIELNPSLAQAHCALGDSLAYSGRLDESVPRFEEAVRISPRDPYRWAFLTYGAMAHLFRHDFDEAAKWGLEATRVPNAHYGANAALVAALGHLERREEAQAALAALLRIRPEFNCHLARERLFYLKDPRQLELYVEGLRKAGVPE